MSEVTLKPCPFCQGEATLTEWPDLEALVGYKQPDPPSYWVVCPECEAGHPPYHDRNEAIAAWNTRPAQDERLAAMQAEVERLRGWSLRAFTVVEWVCGEGWVLDSPQYCPDDLLCDGVELLGVYSSDEARAALGDTK